MTLPGNNGFWLFCVKVLNEGKVTGHCRSLVSVANFTSCGFVAFVAKKRKVIKNCKYVPVLRFFGYVCKCKIFARISKHVGLDWDRNAVT